MATDNFLAELSNLSIEDWQYYCLRKFGGEKFAGGVKEALSVATKTFMQMLLEIDQKAKIPRLLLLDDFLKESPAIEPSIIEGLIPTNKFIILAGPPKEGKGLLILEILHSLAEGTAIMDRFDPPELAENECVVYFGMEDGAAEIKSRLEKRQAKNLPFYVCTDPINMGSPEGFAMFEMLIADLPHKPILVVIDSLRRAYPLIRDYNNAAEVAPHMYNLCDWAHDNCALMLSHHTNKSPLATGVNRISGSNAVVSSADGYILFSDKTIVDENTLNWKMESSGRGNMRGSYRLKGDMRTYKITIMSEIEEARAKKEENATNNLRLCASIYKYAVSAKEVNVQMIADTLQIAKAVAQRRIYELIDMDLLKKNGAVSTEAGKRKASMYVALKNSHGEYLFPHIEDLPSKTDDFAENYGRNASNLDEFFSSSLPDPQGSEEEDGEEI